MNAIKSGDIPVIGGVTTECVDVVLLVELSRGLATTSGTITLGVLTFVVLGVVSFVPLTGVRFGGIMI
jgi:hypothetical protein